MSHTRVCPSGAQEKRLQHRASGLCLARSSSGASTPPPSFSAAAGASASVSLRTCSAADASQSWSYNSTSGSLSSSEDGLCLVTSAASTTDLRVGVHVAGTAAGCAGPAGGWDYDQVSGFLVSRLPPTQAKPPMPAAGALCLAARAEGVFNMAS